MSYVFNHNFTFLRALLKNFKILIFSFKANYKIAFLLQHKIKKEAIRSQSSTSISPYSYFFLIS